MNAARPSSPLLRELAWSLVLALSCSAALFAVFTSVEYQWRWDAIWDRRFLIMQGWGLTMVLAFSAIVLTIMIALALMLGQRSAISPVRLLARGTVEFVRGTPLLVLLLLGYYGVANAFRLNAPLPVGVIVLSLFEGAYLAEIFRGAWESISASQL
ncbi:MAG: ABC transporter permease subunit, partial [Roseimicrobium sp.]